MGFGIDMAKAREIHKTNIRSARAPKLAELTRTPKLHRT